MCQRTGKSGDAESGNVLPAGEDARDALRGRGAGGEEAPSFRDIGPGRRAPRAHGDAPPHSALDSCIDCQLSSRCLPALLAAGEIHCLDAVAQRNRRVRKNRHLFRDRDTCAAIYVVRQGALKSYSISEGGQEQVTGFHFSGELVGIDGIAGGVYKRSAVALAGSVVCEIPFDPLVRMTASAPDLQRNLIHMMSHEIVRDQLLIVLLSNAMAGRRVAAFLLDIAGRIGQPLASGIVLFLPMTRGDIGNHLGLTLETVSRMFRRFEQLGWLRLAWRQVVILAPQPLRAIAEGRADLELCERPSP